MLSSLVALRGTRYNYNRIECGIFLDIQKAFEIVNHQVFLQKLYHYGMRHYTKLVSIISG